MKIKFLPLAQINSEFEFGFKAKNLAIAYNSGLKVPNGFACNKDTCYKLVNNELKNNNSFEETFVNWLYSINNLVSIRSSAIIQSIHANLVSGLFKTERRVPPFERNVISTMYDILEDASFKKEKYTFIKTHPPNNKIEIAILVQQEINCLISGVLHSISTENSNCIDLWFKYGDLAPLMAGMEQGYHVRIPKNGNIKEVWCSIEAFDFGHKIGFWSILPELIVNMNKLEKVFNNNALLIEWGRDTGDLYILQVQHLSF